MKKVVSFFLLCSICLTMYAQDSNNELLKKLVEKQVLTQSEADQISQESESKSSNNSFSGTINKVREAFNTPYLKFGGYGLLLYKYQDLAKVKHDFEPRVIFVSMNGKLTKELSYSVLAEFVNPELYELYGEWIPSKQFGVRVGQFKVPFSLENPISLTNLETISNTRSISSLTGMGDDVLKLQNGKNNSGRDIGIQLSGSLFPVADSHDLLQYSMGVFQGSGITSAERDNSKDFTGMLLLQPIKGFRIGGGAFFGEATYTASYETATRSHVRNRWIISSDYQSDRFAARAEWLHGKDGIIDREGLYGTMTYYLVPEKFNAVAKVDYYNKDKDNNSEVIDYTIAANYYFYKQCRFQLNYTYSDYSDKWGSRNTNAVSAQLQYVF